MLTVNSLIEWHIDETETPTDAQEQPPTLDRILWLEPATNQIVLFDVQSPKALPRWESLVMVETALDTGQVRLLQSEPFANLRRTEEDIPLPHRQRRDAIWDRYIRALVQTETEQPRLEILDATERGKLIAVIVEQTGVQKKTVYRDLRRYWQAGQIKNGLLPRYNRSGGPGKTKSSGKLKRGRPKLQTQLTGQPSGVNVDEAMSQLFRRGIRLFYENKEKRTLKQTYELTLRKFFNIGYVRENGILAPNLPPASELPTLGQFRYWYKQQWQPEREIVARQGQRIHNLKSRPVLGSSMSLAFGPGSLYQLDATVADVYLVSAIDPTRIIGRPVLYLVVDVFSRMIVGFAVTLEGPNWTGAMLALFNTMSNKVTFCNEFGITITSEQWSSCYAPERILADRGELEGYNADSLVNGLGIIVANTPPYRADWKAVVERYFRLTNDRGIHWLPGAVDREKSRGDHDYRLDACLTLNEFRQILIWIILEHNNEYRMDWYPLSEAMIRDDIQPYPNEIWQWGIQNQVGVLRSLPENVIYPNLLRRDECAVARDGIHFKGLRYTCQKAEDEGWFTRARVKGRWRIKAAYDPRRVDNIYLRLDHQSELERCTLLPQYKMYLGWGWYEFEDYQALKKLQSTGAESRQKQARANTDAQIEQLVSTAQERQKEALAETPLSKTARTKNIRENRREERSADYKNNPTSTSSPPTDPEIEPPTDKSSALDSGAPTYVPIPSQRERLRQLRAKQWQIQDGNQLDQHQEENEYDDIQSTV